MGRVDARLMKEQKAVFGRVAIEWLGLFTRGKQLLLLVNWPKHLAVYRLFLIVGPVGVYWYKKQVWG